MVDSRRPHAVVIGGGFSGTLVAANLVSRDPHVKVTLLEASRVAGRGVAYDTPDAAHLLNVPAGRMSAFEDAPDNFVSWARSRGCAVDGSTFASRRLYGDYLEDVLARARASADRRLTVLNGRATDVRRSSSGHYDLAIEGQGALKADAVVLALGHAPALLPGASAPASKRVVLDPWAQSNAGANCLPTTLAYSPQGIPECDITSRARRCTRTSNTAACHRPCACSAARVTGCQRTRWSLSD